MEFRDGDHDDNFEGVDYYADVEPADQSPNVSSRNLLATRKSKVIAGTLTASALVGIGLLINSGGSNEENLSIGRDSVVIGSDGEIPIDTIELTTTTVLDLPEVSVINRTIPTQVSNPSTTIADSLPELTTTVHDSSNEPVDSITEVPVMTLPPTTLESTTTTEPRTTTTEATTTTVAPTTTEETTTTTTSTTIRPTSTTEATTTTTSQPETTTTEPITTTTEVTTTTEAPRIVITIPEITYEDCYKPFVRVPENAGRIWLEELSSVCNIPVEQLEDNSEGLNPDYLLANERVWMRPHGQPVTTTEATTTTTEATTSTTEVTTTTLPPTTTTEATTTTSEATTSTTLPVTTTTEATTTTVAPTTTEETTTTTTSTTIRPTSTTEATTTTTSQPETTTTEPITTTTEVTTTTEAPTTTEATTTTLPIRANTIYSRVDCNANSTTIIEGMWPSRLAMGCDLTLDQLVSYNTQECDLLNNFIVGETVYLQPNIAPVTDCSVSAPSTTETSTPGNTDQPTQTETTSPATTNPPNINTENPWINCDDNFITVPDGAGLNWAYELAVGCDMTMNELREMNPDINFEYLIVDQRIRIN